MKINLNILVSRPQILDQVFRLHNDIRVFEAWKLGHELEVEFLGTWIFDQLLKSQIDDRFFDTHNKRFRDYVLKLCMNVHSLHCGFHIKHNKKIKQIIVNTTRFITIQTFNTKYCTNWRYNLKKNIFPRMWYLKIANDPVSCGCCC